MYISKVRHNKALRIVNGEVQECWSSWEAEVSLTDGEDPKEGALMAENFVNSKQGYGSGDVAGNIKRDVTHKDEETEQLWNLVCDKLKAFEFREDAQEYLDTTEFKMTLDAKKIVGSKPSKNKPKMDMVILKKYEKAIADNDEKVIGEIKERYHVEN